MLYVITSVAACIIPLESIDNWKAFIASQKKLSEKIAGSMSISPVYSSKSFSWCILNQFLIQA